MCNNCISFTTIVFYPVDTSTVKVYGWDMHQLEVKGFQATYKMNNLQLARLTGKSESTVLRWRKGLQKVDSSSERWMKIYDMLFSLIKEMNGN